MPISKYEDSAWYRMAYSLEKGQWVQLPEGQSWDPPHPHTWGDCSPDAALFGFVPPPPPLGRRAAATAPAATCSLTPPSAGPPLARAQVKSPPEGLLPPRLDAQGTMKAPPARRLRESRGWDLPPPPPPAPPSGWARCIHDERRRAMCAALAQRRAALFDESDDDELPVSSEPHRARGALRARAAATARPSAWLGSIQALPPAAARPSVAATARHCRRYLAGGAASVLRAASVSSHARSPCLCEPSAHNPQGHGRSPRLCQATRASVPRVRGMRST